MLLTYKDIATFTAGSHISRIQQSGHGRAYFFMQLNTFWQMTGSIAKVPTAKNKS
ncbi:Uncharacterised protein [Serratia fonticola]|uniref:hypothetical protein n=1 Tax=Serratia fonticola TaxID=47917 RepID=UPI002179DA95|nr:hypothetical protein [Serratia fonticola]CAI0890143.1 Uncharacterised protein [Serratia fonticola]CAI0898510.1 Uncharacterised protein [Serratia fonticola]CAI1515092.1 Uncharacterised protein [Serratia fonticola]CAI1788627.1 Uncharacterised protein [Serratia fonticola]